MAFSSGRAVPTMSAGGGEGWRQGRGEGAGGRGELSLLIRAENNRKSSRGSSSSHRQQTAASASGFNGRISLRTRSSLLN